MTKKRRNPKPHRDRNSGGTTLINVYLHSLKYLNAVTRRIFIRGSKVGSEYWYEKSLSIDLLSVHIPIRTIPLQHLALYYLFNVLIILFLFFQIVK